MSPRECPFEAEVLEAALHTCWDPELRAHLESCATCADIAAVAGAIEAERAAPPAIPDSGRMWWMAQHRARLEAAQAANRPMTAVQAIALVCAAVVLIAYLPAAVSRIHGTWFVWVGSLLLEHGLLAIGMAAVLLLLPAAVYLAIGRE
jgi:hypothetical protein